MRNPEKLNHPRHVDSLRILVHPMYFHGDPYPTPIPVYAASQNRFAENVVSRFTPRTAGEVLLVMPNVDEFHSLRNDVQRQKEIKVQDPSKQIWPDLFKQLKASSPIPHNIRFVDNIGRSFDPDGTVITERLKQLGFFMDKNTEIIIGGQWLDRCVTTAAKKILRLPNVEQVKIDRHSSVVSSEFEPYLYPPLIDGEPFEPHSDQDYYYYRKVA